jgi:integrase
MKNIFSRNGMYYFRKQIPDELLKFYRTRELRGSLKTRDKREAEKRSHAALAAIEAEFDQHRAELGKAQAEAEFLQSPAFLAERDEWFKVATQYGFPTVSHIPTVEQMTSWVGKQADEISFDGGEISREGLGALKEVVDAEIEVTGRSIASQHAPSIELIGDDVHTLVPPHLRERLADLVRKVVEDERASLAALQAATSKKSSNDTAESLSLEFLKDGWIKERKVTSRTVLEMNTAIRRFYETVGQLPYTDINPDHCRSFRAALSELNVKNATKKKQWTMLNTLFAHAVDNDLIERSPFSALKMRLSDDSRARDDFTHSVLRQLFTTTDRQNEDWWLCRIALYTGARLGEINQLTRQDVVSIEGVEVISINDNDGKSVKNRNSIRHVPIHSQLIRDGLLDWLPATGRLFSNSTPRVSKRLNRRIKAVAPPELNIVVHSFRHTFISACREAVIGEEVRNRLTGHTEGRVARGYGGHSIKSLQDAINRVTFGIETE